MKVLGIIPARGGSKRVPRKNLRPLGGKPLITWAVETAYHSRVFDKVVISSEDEEIGRLHPELWWRRDPKLAEDNSPMLPVVTEIVDHIKADVVILMQPTSPFRTAEDIQNALYLLNSSKGDAVISVTEAPNDLCYEVGFAKRLRDVPNVVVPNGCLFLITREALLDGYSWFTAPLTYGYSMPKDRSLDIDTEVDFELARYLVSSGKNKASAA